MHEAVSFNQQEGFLLKAVQDKALEFSQLFQYFKKGVIK
jgi:hypothetical protein